MAYTNIHKYSNWSGMATIHLDISFFPHSWMHNILYITTQYTYCMYNPSYISFVPSVSAVSVESVACGVRSDHWVPERSGHAVPLCSRRTAAAHPVRGQEETKRADGAYAGDKIPPLHLNMCNYILRIYKMYLWGLMLLNTTWFTIFMHTQSQKKHMMNVYPIKLCHYSLRITFHSFIWLSGQRPLATVWAYESVFCFKQCGVGLLFLLIVCVDSSAVRATVCVCL